MPSLVPVSLKPPGTMVTHLAPRSRHCFRESTVNLAEMAITAPSMVSGIEQSSPYTVKNSKEPKPFAFTKYVLPLNL